MGLPPERLDLADALQIVHEQGVHGAGGFALDAVAAMRGQRVPQRADGQDGKRNHGHGGQQRIRPKENGRHADDAQQGYGPLLHSVDQDALDGVHVLNHARHQIAGGALVEIVHRQPLQPRINVAPHVKNHLLLELVVDADAQAVEHVAQQKRAQQRQHHRREQVGALVADDVINNELRELRIHEGESQREQRAAEDARRHPFVGPQIDGNAPEDFPGRTRFGGERRVSHRSRI